MWKVTLAGPRGLKVTSAAALTIGRWGSCASSLISRRLLLPFIFLLSFSVLFPLLLSLLKVVSFFFLFLTIFPSLLHLCFNLLFPRLASPHLPSFLLSPYFATCLCFPFFLARLHTCLLFSVLFSYPSKTIHQNKLKGKPKHSIPCVRWKRRPRRKRRKHRNIEEPTAEILFAHIEAGCF